jgi:hypothetical protein
MGWLLKSIASGVLLLAMSVSVGLLGVHRFQIVAVVILVASAIVLVAWGSTYLRRFGRSGPLDQDERRAAEAGLRGRGPTMPDLHDEHRRPTR